MDSNPARGILPRDFSSQAHNFLVAGQGELKIHFGSWRQLALALNGGAIFA